MRQTVVVGTAILVGLMAYFPIVAATSGHPEPTNVSVDMPIEGAVEAGVTDAVSASSVPSSVLRLLEATGSATQISLADLEEAGLPSSVARLLIERDSALALPDTSGAG